MTSFINKYGILAICILIFLEYACFPLPSEILLPLSGGVAKELSFNFFYLVLLSSISALLGALACYTIGYFGGKGIISLTDRKEKLKKGMDLVRERYLKYANLSTFILRLVPVCRTYISFIAGIYKQNLLIYSITSFLGAFIWNALLLGLGYFTIGNKESITVFFDKYRIVILIIILISLIGSIVFKELKRRKRKLL